MLSPIEIRHYLHAHPELSGEEYNTHDFIVRCLRESGAAEILEHVAGQGVVALFKGKTVGKNIAIRGDIDALPIADCSDVAYHSVNQGVGHKCGHDGHTAILLQLAQLLTENRPEKGDVILIFQPEEETGNGARKMMESAVLEPFNINYIFGLHNLPAFPLGAVVVKSGTFAAASSGMIINLLGRETHAAHPENGINPSLAVSELIQAFEQINRTHKESTHFQQVTLIYTRIGKVAFGTSAGDAEMMVTLRAFSNELMNDLTHNVLEKLQSISDQYRLNVSHQFVEAFPAVENLTEDVSIIENAAIKLGKQLIHIELPFRWSEDFAHYQRRYRGAFFGIGSGEHHVELHHPNYDFPDELVADGAAVFYQIINEINDFRKK